MNEQELRSIVRAAVARHFGAGAQPGDPAGASGRPAPPPAAGQSRLLHTLPHGPGPVPLLASQSLYTGLVNVTDACVIEPAVSCDHCGYCKSHGY